jgi:large subunit ribosomal protein L23
MNQERIIKILIKPHVSEKTADLTDSVNQHCFRVMRDATKKEIKAAVELLFSVKVDAVRVLNVRGKRKVTGRIVGKRKDWKKAFITLAEGNDIDFSTLGK